MPLPPKIFKQIPGRDKKGKQYLIIVNQEIGKDLKKDNDKKRQDGTTERTLELSSFFLENGLLRDPYTRIEHIYKTKNNIYLLIKTDNTLDIYKRHLWRKNAGWTLLSSKTIPINAKILGMNPITKAINIEIGDCTLAVPFQASIKVDEPKIEK